MTDSKTRWTLVTAATLLACALPLHPAPITTGSLIEEMVDLKRLAEFPDPAFKVVQFSSHDRRSRLPGGPDWYANSDGFGNEPTPNFEKVLKQPDQKGIGEYLICDVAGPGALVRTWTARIDGAIRLYLDGKEEPVFDGPAVDFFLKTYAPYCQAADVDPEALAGAYQQRQACYFPMPFARRCRIVWTGNLKRIHFYEVQFRLYDRAAQVQTFAPADLKTFRQPILDVAKMLQAPDQTWAYPANSKETLLAVALAARETREVLSLEGARAIERLTLQAQAADLDRALRQTILHVQFDGYPWGQIQCPVGDFFGAAPGINPYVSVPFTVQPDGRMICRFVMPFARSMKLKLENRGDQPVNITGAVLTTDYPWNKKSSMHFRARWRVDHDLLNTAVYDLPFLLAHGQGVYVGTASILMNPNPVPTPYGNWWGEGDEKIFVDDDYQPSIFGTGSEDYYNYAWSAPDIFAFPYCGQPRNDGPGNRGFVTNFRWHILDPIPFRHQLAFYLEFYSHERTPGYSYARIAYHYARPGVMDDHVPISNEDVRPPKLADWRPAARGGAKGARFFQMEELASGGENVSLEEGDLFAGGQVWVWHPEPDGDTFAFRAPIEADGRYVIGFTARLSPESGTFSATANDRPLNFGDGPISLHRAHRVLLRNFLSEPVELKQGPVVIQLKSEGPAEGGEGREVGLDFLWIQKK